MLPRTFVVLTCLLLLGACSSVPTVRFLNFPEQGFTWGDVHWLAGFDLIRQEGFNEGSHTCGSMTQEYRDYLHAMSVPYDRMRLVSSKKVNSDTGEEEHHLHLEVYKLSTEDWRVYDPQTGAFGYLYRPDGWEVVQVYDGDTVVIQLNGYGHLGKRYHDGEWYPR